MSIGVLVPVPCIDKGEVKARPVRNAGGSDAASTMTKGFAASISVVRTG